jgi:hypothetical protein
MVESNMSSRDGRVAPTFACTALPGRRVTVFVGGPGDHALTITDMHGRTVCMLNGTRRGEHVVLLGAPGLYLVQVQSSHGNAARLVSTLR